jgi:hypothetical protein
MSHPTQYSFNYNDGNYRNAVNHDGTSYYNNPITITINDVLLIMPFGNSDVLSTQLRENELYIIGENKGLEYISMTVINLSDYSISECYLSSNDINDKDGMAYDIFELDLDKQIAVLENYLPY